MTIDKMLETGLPLNRKERFFTGTVFPMIVCKDNFKHIGLLFSLLGLASCPEISAAPDEANIQFFTEYSLVESLIGDARKRFPGLPLTKDTPDIAMFVDAEPKIMIALEAKMYDLPSRSQLRDQMAAQKRMLECIRLSLGINKTYHYALLPEKLKCQMEGLGFDIVTWDALYDTYKPVCDGDYFHRLLCTSLDKYDELVSTGFVRGLNCEKRMSGREISERFKSGTLNMVSMGRDGGIDGYRLESDVTTGKWRSFQYETNSKRPEDVNANWFLIEDFMRLVCPGLRPKYEGWE
jgi:hypothetical protein